MFSEYDVVRLASDLDGCGLQAGTQGTIVMVYPVDPPEYEVEFVDPVGRTLAVATVSGRQIERVG